MKIPIVHQSRYGVLTIQLVFLLGGLLFAYWVDSIILWIAFFCILLATGLLRAHTVSWLRNGKWLIEQGKFDEAIICYQEGCDYLEKNLWVDKYRHVILFNCSQMSYREMALCNIAFCYGQMGNAKKTQEYYQKVLKQFPDNIIAKTGLNLLNPLLEQVESHPGQS